jgi:hypothetical protein
MQNPEQRKLVSLYKSYRDVDANSPDLKMSHLQRMILASDPYDKKGKEEGGEIITKKSFSNAMEKIATANHLLVDDIKKDVNSFMSEYLLSCTVGDIKPKRKGVSHGCIATNQSGDYYIKGVLGKEGRDIHDIFMAKLFENLDLGPIVIVGMGVTPSKFMIASKDLGQDFASVKQMHNTSVQLMKNHNGQVIHNFPGINSHDYENMLVVEDCFTFADTKQNPGNIFVNQETGRLKIIDFTAADLSDNINSLQLDQLLHNQFFNDPEDAKEMSIEKIKMQY